MLVRKLLIIFQVSVSSTEYRADVLRHKFDAESAKHGASRGSTVIYMVKKCQRNSRFFAEHGHICKLLRTRNFVKGLTEI